MIIKFLVNWLAATIRLLPSESTRAISKNVAATGIDIVESRA